MILTCTDKQLKDIVLALRTAKLTRKKDPLMNKLRDFFSGLDDSTLINGVAELLKDYQKEIDLLVALFPEVLSSPKKENVDIVAKRTHHNTNIVDGFSAMDFTTLFHSLSTARLYFEKETDRKIKEYLFEQINDSYIGKNEDINIQIKKLKNDLFKNIIDFLIKKNSLEKNQYYQTVNGVDTFVMNLYEKENHKFNRRNHPEFGKILNLLHKELLTSQGIIEFNQRYIPNISGTIASNREIYDVYNAAVFLSNFDSIILNRFNSILDVNGSVFSTFDDPIEGFKYIFRPKGKVENYWMDDNHMSESAEQLSDRLSEIFITTIERKDKQNEFTGDYLTRNDFYALSALIDDWERKKIKEIAKDINATTMSRDPVRMFVEYVEKIREELLDYINSDGTSETSLVSHFKELSDTIFSLYDYIQKIKEKEKRSKDISVFALLGNVLNNSFGAVYATYGGTSKNIKYKELYSHNTALFAAHRKVYSRVWANKNRQALYNVNRVDGLVDNENFSDFILTTLGLYISPKEIDELKRNLQRFNKTRKFSENKEILEKQRLELLRENLKEILQAIVPPKIEGEDYQKTAFDKILENEKAISEGRLEDVDELLLEGVYGKMQGILNIYLIKQKSTPLTTIEMVSGEKIPTFKLANLAYNDVEILYKRLEFERNNEDISYHSLFADSDKRFSKSDMPTILGTTTKLELVARDLNKRTAYWTPIESFTANFVSDFLGLATNPKLSWYNLSIGNFSDKNTILAKQINKNLSVEGKNIIGGNEAMSEKELTDFARLQQYQFLFDTYREIIDKFNKLFDLSLPKSEKDVEKNYTKINDLLSKTTPDRLLKLAEEKEVQLVEEKDYSSYSLETKNADKSIKTIKVLGLNQNLFDYLKIYSTEANYNDFVKEDLNNTVFDIINSNKTNSAKYLLTSSDIDNLGDNGLENILKYFNIPKEELKDFIEEGNILTEEDEMTQTSRKTTSILIKDSKGNINPILKRWYLTNNLLRNEYLNITVKHEYMHKAKNLKARTFAELGDYDNFMKEASPRYSGMAKRNVAFTSTFERAVQNFKYGIPPQINIAVIRDPSDFLYNINGNSTNQEFQDGSSTINYLYSRMVSASYPGKDYGDTLKRFGTFITPTASSVKKDAEQVLTNKLIRNSVNLNVSDNKDRKDISYKQKQKQMLSSHQIEMDNFEMNTEGLYITENGRYYKVNAIKIDENILTRYLIEVDTSGKPLDNIIQEVVYGKIEYLYDIWEALGAQYSGTFENNKYVFNEESNNILYNIVTNQSDLKNKMIHIISNGSTFKSGATALNNSEKWYNDKTLTYTTFDSSNIGPQLDAGHSADASQIKEISQVLSALAQSDTTSTIAHEAYQDIAKLIIEAAKPYLKTLDKLNPKDLNNTMIELSRDLVKHIASSKGTTLASSLVSVFDNNVVLPFSNQNFFEAFIQNLMIKLNTDFIARYYNGLGAVLLPSHKAFQVYDLNGITYTQETLFSKALQNVDLSKFVTEKDRVIFGHPGIGKTFLHKKGIESIIDFDSEYKNRINKELGLPEGDEGLAARQAYRKEHKEEYNQKIRNLWNQAKADAQSNGKQLFASDMIILREFSQDFDKFITMTPESFIEKSHQRGEFDDANKLLWKQDIDNALLNVDPSKILLTDKYLSDIMLTDKSSNEVIFKNFITDNFKNVYTTLDEAQLGDAIIIDGVEYILDKPEEYYRVKYKLGFGTKKEIEIIKNRPRDLKPQEFSFSIMEMPKTSFKEKLIRELSFATLPENLVNNVKFVSPAEIKKLAQVKYPIEAVTINGVIHINDKISDDLKKVLILHETVGHNGLRALFSSTNEEENKTLQEDFKSILLSAENYLINNDELVKRSGFENVQALANAYGYDTNTEEGKLLLLEELLARQAEEPVELTWFEKAIGRIQLTLARVFGLNAPLNREGVIELLLMSRKALVSGQNFATQLKEDESFFPVVRKKTMFDLDSVRLKILFEQPKLRTPEDERILEEFAQHFKIYEGKTLNKKKMNFYLQQWVQRELAFMDHKRALKSIYEATSVKEYFGKDNLIQSIFEDVKENYRTIEVFDYKFKNAELVLPNIYKTTFDTGNDTVQEIKEQGELYFKNKLTKTYENDDTNGDIKVILPTGEVIYIKLVHDLEWKTQNKTLVVVEDKVTYRLDKFGKKLYKVPENGQVVVENGVETIYLKIGTPSVDKSIAGNYIKSIERILNSFREIKAIVPILNNTIDNVFHSSGNKVNVQKEIVNYFLKFIGVNDVAGEDAKKWFEDNKEGILNTLSKKQFISWDRSRYFISARIPAQSMQSFMPMENVAYFGNDTNNAYVSIWQIWLQGSDFDIDKSYLMGYGFNKNSQLDLWNDLFDYSTKEELDAIELLPIPTNSLVELHEDGLDINSFTQWYQKILSRTGLNKNFTDITKVMAISDINTLTQVLQLVKDYTRELSKKALKANVADYVNTVVKVNGDEDLINFINRYNSYTGYIDAKYALQNSIVSKALRIITTPSNQLLATSPVSIQQWHDGATAGKVFRTKRIKETITEWVDKKSEVPLKQLITTLAGVNIDSINDDYKSILRKRQTKKDAVEKILNEVLKLIERIERFSPTNSLGMYKQQQQAIIGKQDVGIGANGLKVTFALTDYYNQWYDNLRSGKESIKEFDNKLFNKELFVNNKTRSFVKMADVKISHTQLEEIYDYYGITQLEEEYKAYVALALSGFVSGATDNAKELVMAKINAVVDLAAMHIYMLTLGYSAEEISTYMNSDLAKYVAEGLESNLYNLHTNKKGDTISKRQVKDLVDEYVEKSSDIYSPEKLKKERNAFLDIYEGGKEISAMASIFKVNTSMKGNTDELHKYLSNIENTMYSAEVRVFDFSLGELKGKWSKVPEKSKIELIEKILDKNNSLNNLYQKDPAKVIAYIYSVLEASEDIPVYYIDYYGKERVKTVQLKGGEFDIRYYMHPKNSNYREATVNYYNLIKNTYNIFDVLEEVPHFREMVHSVGVTFQIAMLASKKFNFVFSYLKDIIMERKNLSLSTSGNKYNERIKNYFGNSALRFDLDETFIKRGFRTFDNMMVGSWLRSNDPKVTGMKFPVKDLLKKARINKITLYTSDRAKIFTDTELESAASTNLDYSDYTKTITADGIEDFVVDLSTDHGIANFKIVMEQVLLSILQDSSELGKLLSLRPVKNYLNQYSNQIIPIFGLSNLNNSVSIENFSKIVNEFNAIDRQMTFKVTNTASKPLKWKELLYVYNLIVNNEAYGDLKLTALFQDYAKEENSIAESFLKYSLEIDSNRIDLLEINTTGEDKKVLGEELINQIMFSVFNNLGYLKIGEKMLKINNLNFPINSVLYGSDYKSGLNFQYVRAIISVLGNQNLIVNYICK